MNVDATVNNLRYLANREPDMSFILNGSADLIKSLRRREQAVVGDLKYYLENNEENGVVYVPRFIVEKIINNAKEGENK